MSPKELEKYLEDLRKFSEEISSSPEKSLSWLQYVGIIDKNGKLAAQYGGDGEETKNERGCLNNE